MEQNIKSAWDEWKIVQTLGSGTYGKVYKAVKRDHNIEMVSAIKVIEISKSLLDSDIITTDYETKIRLREILERSVREIEIMSRLKSEPNIVSIDDFKVIDNEMGWDIYIRMELLTKFSEYLDSKTVDRKLNLTESEIIKIGTDICSALELCAKQNPPIVHRDIKPSNILVTKSGNFKLGDFGEARELKESNTMGTGTWNYVAPEVMRVRSYGISIDIYSLGIVLYQIANNNRLPFWNPHSQLAPMNSEIETALQKRIEGKEPLPMPINASEQLTQVILKACAFNPEKRFQSAAEFKAALEAVANSEYNPDTSSNPEPVIELNIINNTAYETMSVRRLESVSAKSISKDKKEVIQSVINQSINIIDSKPVLPKNVLTKEEVTKLIGDHIIIPYGYTEIGKYAFEDKRDIASIKIPDSVTIIGDNAFSYNNLTSIEIPESVTNIGHSAFFECNNLTSIEIPDSVTNIGYCVFWGCSSLTRIKIPDNVTFSGGSMFTYCYHLTSIEIPKRLTCIGDSMFKECGLTSIKIPDSVTDIGREAFSRCESLTSIEIPNSVMNIGSMAFADCDRLTSIEISKSLINIGDSAFKGCSQLASIEIPDSVTNIGSMAFADCKSLTSIEIPNSVTSISDRAFLNCSNLSGITIPNSVTNIGYTAFSGCDKLTISCSKKSYAYKYCKKNILPVKKL